MAKSTKKDTNTKDEEFLNILEKNKKTKDRIINNLQLLCTDTNLSKERKEELKNILINENKLLVEQDKNHSPQKTYEQALNNYKEFTIKREEIERIRKSKDSEKTKKEELNKEKTDKIKEFLQAYYEDLNNTSSDTKRKKKKAIEFEKTTEELNQKGL